MEKCGRKIRLPKEFEVVDTVVVPKADIDYNGHMSNAKYILLANEYVEDITCVNRIRVEYKSQARYKSRNFLYLCKKKVRCTEKTCSARFSEASF